MCRRTCTSREFGDTSTVFVGADFCMNDILNIKKIRIFITVVT